MSDLFVDCAVPVAVDTLFTYSVPQELRSSVQRGSRLLLPFGKRTLIGVVATMTTTSNVPRIRPILDVLDPEPVFSEDMLALADWISEYYFAPLGEVMKAMLVQGSMHSAKRRIRFIPDAEKPPASALSKTQASILQKLEGKESLAVSHLQKQLGAKSLHSHINSLARKGLIEVLEEPRFYTPAPKLERCLKVDQSARRIWNEHVTMVTKEPQKRLLHTLLSSDDGTIGISELIRRAKVSLSTIRTMEKKGILAITQRKIHHAVSGTIAAESERTPAFTLTQHQQKAVGAITEALDQHFFQAFLLHGITGSGKTHVYIEAIRRALELKKTAIVLVPEISLTPQIVHRFRAHFGDQVVTFHSRMSARERYDGWRSTKEGKYSIVIGPRSAVFAPLKNLGLIVVDEEHEPSYKQYDQTPRYHARDVALMRARPMNAVVVLGSATPSMESYANAAAGKYTLLELPERIDIARLPDVVIVDMAAERRRQIQEIRDDRAAERAKNPDAPYVFRKTTSFSSISSLLQSKIEERLHKREGIILLQNRRGYAPFIECPDCGHVEMCDRCSISLTYHIAQRHLRCHYCGQVKEPPDSCSSCKGTDIAYRGIGTQKVEEDLLRMFPSATILRMDLDTTTRKGSHDAILRSFALGEADILLGTQMVAKGLDFSRVTLVGVISADTQMLLPDFRSAERTFQLLTQVAGRAGRSALAGEVVIQSYQPSHESLKHVPMHDYRSFFKEEMNYRQELKYPPVARLVLAEFRGTNENETMRQAELFAHQLQKDSKLLDVLGPAPAVIARIRGAFRWHVVVKSEKATDQSGRMLHDIVAHAMRTLFSSPAIRGGSVRMIVDVDPVGLM